MIDCNSLHKLKDNNALNRLEPIMLWKLPILLLSNAQNQAQNYAHKIKLYWLFITVSWLLY